MSNLVIAAIPSDDDYVWKLSSEKVPHVTLLFLGELSDTTDVLQIQLFLAHAVKLWEQGRFMLEVDRRGTLGPDEADVVFFRENFMLKQLESFRGQLLKNEFIRRAYEAQVQYDFWTPHLTMGYPNAPAKEDDRDYPGVRWIDFDRIALWTGDYSGPEFRLEYNFDMEVSMGALSHHGVKGMRWGVRKDREIPKATAVQAKEVITANRSSKTKIKTTGGENHPAHADAIKVAEARQKLRKSGPAALSNDELRDVAMRLNLEQQVSRLNASTPTNPATKFVKDTLGNIGKQHVTRLANQKANDLMVKK